MKSRSSKQTTPTVMTAERFAVLGGGKIAYINPVRSEDVNRLYPNAPEMAPGQKLWVLCAADGTPILVTDSREMAVGNAVHNKLEPVGLH